MLAGRLPKNQPVYCWKSPDGLSCHVDFRFWTSDFMTDCDRPRDRRDTVESLLSESFTVQTFCYLNVFFPLSLSLSFSLWFCTFLYNVPRFVRLFDVGNVGRCVWQQCVAKIINFKAGMITRLSENWGQIRGWTRGRIKWNNEIKFHFVEDSIKARWFVDLLFIVSDYCSLIWDVKLQLSFFFSL